MRPLFSSRASRRFVLHLGPTNSGKTQDALLQLREAESVIFRSLSLFASPLVSRSFRTAFVVFSLSVVIISSLSLFSLLIPIL